MEFSKIIDIKQFENMEVDEIITVQKNTANEIISAKAHVEFLLTRNRELIKALKKQCALDGHDFAPATLGYRTEGHTESSGDYNVFGDDDYKEEYVEDRDVDTYTRICKICKTEETQDAKPVNPFTN